MGEPKRAYHKSRKSEKFKKLDKLFKKDIKQAKRDFYTNIVSDLKQKNPNQWYSAVKRMASYDNKAQEIIVDDINHLSNQEQCEIIADEFSKVPNTFSPLHTADITVPPFRPNEVPQFTAAEVWKKLLCRLYTCTGVIEYTRSWRPDRVAHSTPRQHSLEQGHSPEQGDTLFGTR